MARHLPRLIALAWLAVAVLAITQREWGRFVPSGVMLLLATLRLGRPIETERAYELTYAAAYRPPRLLERAGIEWPRVRLVRYGQDRIELRRHPWLSPVVLDLPEDADRRARIVAAVRTKSALYTDKP